MRRTHRSPSPVPERGAADAYGSLSTAQLRQLLHDEPKLQRIVRLSKKVQSLQSEQEQYLMENFGMAKQNLSLRPWLENGKANLAAKYQQLQEVKAACQEKQRKLEIPLQKWSLQTAVTHIQAELERTEAESEAQVERFLEGTVSLEDFLETFQRSRKVLHLRRCQMEKLQEILRKQRIQCLNIAAAPQSLPLSQHTAAPSTYSLTPAYLIPSFPLPSSPPYRILPPLGTPAGQYRVSQPSTQSLNPARRLMTYFSLLNPKPYRCNHVYEQYRPPH